MDLIEWGDISFGYNNDVDIGYVEYMRKLLRNEKLIDFLFQKKNLYNVKIIFLGIEVLALKYRISEEVGWFLLHNCSTGFVGSYILYCKRLNKYDLNSFMKFVIRQMSICP